MTVVHNILNGGTEVSKQGKTWEGKTSYLVAA